MINCILLLLQAAGLLLIYGDDKASVWFVERTNRDSNRYLIGFNDMMNIQEGQNGNPTMYPTADSPTPNPVEAAPATSTQGRIDTPIEDVSTTVTEVRVAPDSPTPSPSAKETSAPKTPTKFPTKTPASTTVPEVGAIPDSPTLPPSTEESIALGTPTKFPTKPPTPFPTRAKPSKAPSLKPSDLPSLIPSISSPPTGVSASPSMDPTTSEPTGPAPSDGPSNAPNASPSEVPSEYVSEEPSEEPTISDEPTMTAEPSDEPSNSDEPTMTAEPSDVPSNSDEPTMTAEPSDATFDVSNVPTEINEGNSINERTHSDGRDSTQFPGSSFGSLSTSLPSTSELLLHSKSQTISAIICDKDNTYLWGALCVFLRETNFFEILGNIEGRYTLFAPTNEAFENGEYTLETLLQNKSALQSLIPLHIAPLVLPYEALLCNWSTDMLNLDITYTLCIGGTKFQTADGNEISNLPIIDELEDIKAMNGIIHTINNLILPLQFSIDNDLDEEIQGNDILEEIDYANISIKNNENIAVNNDRRDDFEERNIDDLNINDSVSLATAMESVSEFISNRQGLVLNRDEQECQVCASRELCAIPHTAVVQVHGEGEVPCIDIVNRQNTKKGIIMERSMCKALQQKFQESCLIGDGGN